MKKDNIVIDIRKNEFRECVWEGAIHGDRILSLKQINFQYSDEILEADNRIVSSGWHILGKEVKKFESEFAKYVKAKYVIGVNSGYDVLFL